MGGLIPEDVWKSAEVEARKIVHTPIGHDVVKAIALAILEERHRCADVAEGFRQAHDTGSGFDSQPARATAEAIRDAILA